MIYEKLLLLLLLYVIPVKSQPVVPNFTTGTLSSTTNTTTSISETITSTDYFGNSYEYTVMDWESQPMDQSLQIQRMLMGQ